MSYIRSLSNPEGLYIWGDVHGYVAITCQEHKADLIQANQKDWNKLLKGYVGGKFYDSGRCGTLELKEVVIPTGPWEERFPAGARFTGGERKGQLMPKNIRGFQPADWKMVLIVRNPGKPVKKIHMWRVTWDYIARHDQCPFVFGHEKRKKKRR